MEMGPRHAEVRANAFEAEFAIAALEGERMFGADRFIFFNPFVHAPEVRGFEIEFEFVDETRDEGELFGRADGAAYAAGIVGSGSAPGLDVFEGFGEIEFFERVVKDD